MTKITIAPWAVEALGGQAPVRERAREAGRVLQDAGFPPNQIAQMVQQLLVEEAEAIQDQLNTQALYQMGQALSQRAPRA
jgi:phage replication-related protein YjqB (UPF0714/DUF867 family)